MYRLWIGDIDGGTAEDRYAFEWLAAMREGGYDEVRIEPEPDAETTFPLNDDPTDEPETPTLLATTRCPHCHNFVVVSGFEQLFGLSFEQLFGLICPHCGEGVEVKLPEV